MAPDTEELIKKVNTLTLDKNRLKQKLNQIVQSSSSTDSPCLANENSSIIAGVQCSTSCEEDLIYINQLCKQKLDEYDANWDYLQSKCSALTSELRALQKHFSLLNDEKLNLEGKLNAKCEDYDKIKSELQTVVLNYETQIGAMSEHLSMITSRQE